MVTYSFIAKFTVTLMALAVIMLVGLIIESIR